LLDDVFDVLLFDTPPSLVVSDGYTLSATLGASLILVARANKTRPSDILKANSLFRQLDLEVVGSILNFAPEDELGYGYGASYYYYAQDAGATIQQQESLSGVDADNE
jgi:Mrp family chromosome partitioning ATPase